LRKKWQKHFGVIEAVDSSTFRLMARLRHVFLPCGSGGAKKGSANAKGAVKIHQVYHVGDELPADTAVSPARLHDAKGVKKALAQACKGVLYLIDRGYCCFELWRNIDDALAWFITPLKTGMVYEHLKWLSPKKQRDRVRDELVKFPGMTQGEDFYVLRLVHIRQEDGTWWSYVTNLNDQALLTPEDIQEIYSLRWRIEKSLPVASICHGIEIVAAAGVLRGRTVTTVPKCRLDAEGGGATFVNQEVVVSGNLVTARTWHDNHAFMREFMKLLNHRTDRD
jgi:hypothetical protein